MTAIPEIEGVVSIRSPIERFLKAFRQRVAAGLLTGHPHPRSNYLIGASGPGRLEILAADWLTAVNVGLNRVELQPLPSSAVRYHVRYWRWAQYALGLSGALGLAGIALLMTVDVRGYIARNQGSMFPGLSIDQNLTVAWAMVVFWGFIWPWLLIALHQRPLHRLITRLITEVDAVAASGEPPE